MKILSPFSKKEEVIPLIEAGADELYCGIVPDNWDKLYTTLETINRRINYNASFRNFEDLSEAIQLAHSKDIPVYLTMNVPYSEPQYPLILEIVERLCDIDVDGFLVTDIGLLLTLQEKKINKEVHISTGGTTFNSRTANFYKRLGATRIILDRQLTIGEIRSILKDNPDIEFEVFILNTLCYNVDGFCTFYHGIKAEDIEIAPRIDEKKLDQRIKFVYSFDPKYQGAGCGLRFSRELFDNKTGKKIDSPKLSFTIKDIKRDIKPIKHCGACAIFDFNQIGIKVIKIIERDRPLEEKLKDTRFIREALDILKRRLGKEQFIKEVKKLYCHTYKYDRCSEISCYYPSIEQWKRRYSSPKLLI